MKHFKILILFLLTGFSAFSQKVDSVTIKQGSDLISAPSIADGDFVFIQVDTLDGGVTKKIWRKTTFGDWKTNLIADGIGADPVQSVSNDSIYLTYFSGEKLFVGFATTGGGSSDTATLQRRHHNIHMSGRWHLRTNGWYGYGPVYSHAAESHLYAVSTLTSPTDVVYDAGGYRLPEKMFIRSVVGQFRASTTVPRTASFQFVAVTKNENTKTATTRLIGAPFSKNINGDSIELINVDYSAVTDTIFPYETVSLLVRETSAENSGFIYVSDILLNFESTTEYPISGGGGSSGSSGVIPARLISGDSVYFDYGGGNRVFVGLLPSLSDFPDSVSINGHTSSGAMSFNLDVNPVLGAGTPNVTDDNYSTYTINHRAASKDDWGMMTAEDKKKTNLIKGRHRNFLMMGQSNALYANSESTVIYPPNPRVRAYSDSTQTLNTAEREKSPFSPGTGIDNVAYNIGHLLSEKYPFDTINIFLIGQGGITIEDLRDDLMDSLIVLDSFIDSLGGLDYDFTIHGVSASEYPEGQYFEQLDSLYAEKRALNCYRYNTRCTHSFPPTNPESVSNFTAGEQAHFGSGIYPYVGVVDDLRKDLVTQDSTNNGPHWGGETVVHLAHKHLDCAESLPNDNTFGPPNGIPFYGDASTRFRLDFSKYFQGTRTAFGFNLALTNNNGAFLSGKNLAGETTLELRNLSGRAAIRAMKDGVSKYDFRIQSNGNAETRQWGGISVAKDSLPNSPQEAFEVWGNLRVVNRIDVDIPTSGQRFMNLAGLRMNYLSSGGNVIHSFGTGNSVFQGTGIVFTDNASLRDYINLYVNSIESLRIGEDYLSLRNPANGTPTDILNRSIFFDASDDKLKHTASSNNDVRTLATETHQVVSHSTGVLIDMSSGTYIEVTGGGTTFNLSAGINKEVIVKNTTGASITISSSGNSTVNGDLSLADNEAVLYIGNASENDWWGR